jgi:hypothetical protein
MRTKTTFLGEMDLPDTPVYVDIAPSCIFRASCAVASTSNIAAAAGEDELQVSTDRASSC